MNKPLRSIMPLHVSLV